MRASTSRRLPEAWWEQRGERNPYPMSRCKPRSSALGCGTTEYRPAKVVTSTTKNQKACIGAGLFFFLQFSGNFYNSSFNNVKNKASSDIGLYQPGAVRTKLVSGTVEGCRIMTSLKDTNCKGKVTCTNLAFSSFSIVKPMVSARPGTEPERHNAKTVHFH